MIMCSCGHWMFRKFVTDKSGAVCYYYDYCYWCEEHRANEYDGYGNPTHYDIT